MQCFPKERILFYKAFINNTSKVNVEEGGGERERKREERE
jgi:hypothetical protein